MRNVMLSVIFLVVVVYLGAKSYDRLIAEMNDFMDFAQSKIESEPRGYPDTIRLESAEGVVLKVTLQGRDENSVQFFRNSDGKPFIYPIASLSTESQELVRMYPNTSVSKGTDRDEAHSDVEDSHIIELKRRILQINEEMNELKEKFDASNSVAMKRGYRNEALVLDAEGRKLDAEIKQRTSR